MSRSWPTSLYGGPDASDVALYAVLFAAFWTVWISYTLYGNVAAGHTRTRALLLGMACLTVMAAAVHGVREGDRDRMFALAYVVARLFAGRVWDHRRQRVQGWPAARFTAGSAPWVASLWAAAVLLRCRRRPPAVSLWVAALSLSPTTAADGFARPIPWRR
ncbi:low temperature requirement protein A [Streptomyces maremycinicus]|uniref:low temperature requirement protein A n=1 Tax=Streptomyces maremycinicus TaxID=1679753 RepID=UPI000788F80A|nr:low temperature requirement protein A [Streptomyces sp. NBRC 110468]